MEKRISSRAIIIENDEVILMFRRRINQDGIKEYYVIPGGGLELGETLEENVIREVKEEFSVDIKVLEFLGTEENDTAVFNFFLCEIISGTPKLGGPELYKNCESNYYEIKRVKISDINNLDIMARELILKTFKKIDNNK